MVSLSQLTKKYMFLFAMGDSIVTLEEEEGDCDQQKPPLQSASLIPPGNL